MEVGLWFLGRCCLPVGQDRPWKLKVLKLFDFQRGEEGMERMKKINVFALAALLCFVTVGGNVATVEAEEVPSSGAVYVEDPETGDRLFVGEPDLGFGRRNIEDMGRQEKVGGYAARGVPNHLDVGESSQKAENAISITTEQELKAIADNLDGNYVLEADIVLSQGEWVSIGNKDGAFTGTLDGNGHTISNLSSSSGNGLFYYIGEKGVVRDLTVIGEITTTKNDAALLADGSGGEIVNCRSKGNVKQESGVNAFLLAGMVNINYGYMENCVNEAEVAETFGDLGHLYNYSFIGGLVSANYGTIMDCENNAAVLANCMYAGGIAGCNSGNGLIAGCVNTGEVTTIHDTAYACVAVGGITGDNWSGVIYRCVNEGKIEGQAKCNRIGGIAGDSSRFSEIIGCENEGLVVGSRDGVEGSGTGSLGGICGEFSITSGSFDENDHFIVDEGRQIMSDCTNNGQITGGTWMGGIVGIAESGNGEIAIMRCTNNGTVCGGEGTHCGGIAIQVGADGAGSVRLEWLINTGDIEVFQNQWSGSAHGISSVDSPLRQNVITVRNCINKGKIKADSANGIGGGSNAILEQCANFGEVQGDVGTGVGSAIDVKNCYNLGSITGNVTASGIGDFNSGSNCYNTGIVTGGQNSYGITNIDENTQTTSCYYLEQELLGEQAGKALDQNAIQQPQSYEGFDFDNVWVMQEQNGMSLPAFKSEMVLGQVEVSDVRIRANDTALVEPVTGTFINFVSSNPLICKVSSDGKLMPQRVGTVKLYGISGDGQVIDFQVTVDGTELSACQITISPSAFYYDGMPHTPEVTIKDGEKELEKGKDYTVEYKDNIEVGTASAVLTGIGRYTGMVTKTFLIEALDEPAPEEPEKPAPDNPEPEEPEKPDPDNPGAEPTPEPTPVPGEPTPEPTPVPGEPTPEPTPSPEQKNLNSLEISELPSVVYNGTPHTPKVTIKDGKKILEKGKDYTAKYKDNIVVGTANVVLTGIGNYTGTVTKTFTIEKASQRLTCKKTYIKTYGDRPFLLKVTGNGNGKLAFASSNKKVAAINKNGRVSINNTGIAVITVKAGKTDQYHATSAKVTVKIKPAKPKGLSIKVQGRDRLRIGWKKDAKATGYEVWCSTDKKFRKGVKKYRINKKKTSSATVSNLKPGKKYYIRVGSYKNAKLSGKTVKLHSAWNSIIVKMDK